MPDESQARVLDRRRESGPTPRVPAAMERHLQTVLVAVVCGLLAWMGNKVTSTSETVAALRAENRVQITALENEIKRLEAGVARAYTAADSLRELSYRDEAINALEERIRYLERQFTGPPWTVPLPPVKPMPAPPERRGENR